MLRVGDEVKIRDDLKIGRTYGKLYCNRSMPAYAGMITTITQVFSRDFDGYYIKLDGWGNRWSEEMFEPVIEIVNKEDFEEFMRS